MRFACLVLLVSAGMAFAESPLRVASFSGILIELAERVGGEHVRVLSLVPRDADPHEYQPTPSDLARLREARVVLSPGDSLIPAFDRIRAAASSADFLSIGDSPRDSPDPHWWHSVARVREATARVRDRFERLAPEHAADFQKNAAAYLAELEDLARWIERKVAELPRDRRKLVTSHDAFQLLAREYNFTIYAVEGVDADSEPSNRHVAELIDAIKSEHVRAIFPESTLNPKVLREITRETGAKIGGVLYADGLGAGEASTYAGMMRHNVSTIVDALK